MTTISKWKGLTFQTSDQLIAYYHPQVQCRCYWLAMFFHGLDVIHVNLHHGREVLIPRNNIGLNGLKCSQGDQVLKNSRHLLNHGLLHSCSLQQILGKRGQGCPTLNQNYQTRDHGNINEHEYITDLEKKQKLCVMRCLKAAKNRKQKKQNMHISVQTRKICNFCHVHLYKGCFNAYWKIT